MPPPEDEDNGEYFVLSDEERARLEAMFAEMDDENYGAIPDLEDGKTEERKVSEDLSPSQESEAEVTTICSFKISYSNDKHYIISYTYSSLFIIISLLHMIIKGNYCFSKNIF